MSRKLKNPEKKAIGEKIRLARKEVGMSQKQIGSYLKVSDKAVSSYEIGRTTPSYSLLKKISAAVHKPISYFDESSAPGDKDLEAKIAFIEYELQEIKKLLKKRNK